MSEGEAGGVLAPARDRPRRDHARPIAPQVQPELRRVVVEDAKRTRQHHRQHERDRRPGSDADRPSQTPRDSEREQGQASGDHSQVAAARRGDQEAGNHQHHPGRPGADEVRAVAGAVDRQRDAHHDQRREQVRVAEVAVRPERGVEIPLAERLETGHRGAKNERRDHPIALPLGGQQPERCGQKAQVAEPHRQRLVPCVGPGKAEGLGNRKEEGQHRGAGGGNERHAQGAKSRRARDEKSNPCAKAGAGDHNRCTREDVGIAGDG